MYSKISAIIINSIFAICLCYSVLVISVIFNGTFTTETSFVLGFAVFIIAWVALCILYNFIRFNKTGGGLFFWLSLILPSVILSLVLIIVIFLFF